MFLKILIVSCCLLLTLIAHSTWKSWKRLCHIPSPSIVAAFTNFWLARITFSGKQFWVHREWHAHHGPLVRIGPNNVITDDPNVLRDINLTKANYSRGSYYQAGRFNPYHENLFAMLEPVSHRAAKARSAAAYNGADTPGLELLIDEQVEIFMNVIREQHAPRTSSALLDLGDMSNYFTIDVITSLGFGQALGDLRDVKDHYGFLASVHTLWPYMSTIADLPWLRSIMFSPTFLAYFGPKKTDKHGFGVLMAMVDELISQRLVGKGKARADMLDSLIRHGLDKDDLEAEALLLIMAGVESTACAMRTILMYLMATPNAYIRLKHEIAEALESGKISQPISVQQAKKLPYLRATIYEGIRMRPPLLGIWPKVVPTGGTTVHGHFLPAGTHLCANPSAILRSKVSFGDDADIYRPERFTELDQEQCRTMEREVELVFGHGQWGCAGKSIAFMELFKVTFEVCVFSCVSSFSANCGYPDVSVL
jgi:cytochrome P450